MTKKGILSAISLTAALVMATTGSEVSNTDTETVDASVMHSTYTVKQGDNLWRIVFNHDADLDEVAQVNGIEDITQIFPNDELVIPTNKLADFDEDKVIEKVEEVEKEVVEEVVEEEIVEEKKEVAVQSPVSNSKYGEGLADWQLHTLYAVVQQEAVGLTPEDQLRPNAYDSMLAVMSSMTNRVDGDDWYGTNIYEVMTKRNQYEAYGADHYKPLLGNITETTKRAVHDGLNGVKNHNFLNFRSESYARQFGYTGVNIGGNVYFND